MSAFVMIVMACGAVSDMSAMAKTVYGAPHPLAMEERYRVREGDSLRLTRLPLSPYPACLVLDRLPVGS